MSNSSSYKTNINDIGAIVKLFTFSTASFITISTSRQIVSFVATGDFLPLASGSPNFIFVQINWVTFPFSLLISFGGAFSNHLLAVAYLGKIEGIKTLAIVRGEELKNSKLNTTLQKCSDFGMEFEFVSREKYRERNTNKYNCELQNKFKNAYIVPEGGTNMLGVKGCEEILSKYDKEFFDVVCVPVGSGGTFSGLINSSLEKQKIFDATYQGKNESVTHSFKYFLFFLKKILIQNY